MVHLSPLPYSIATSVANVGLIGDLTAFSNTLSHINLQQPALRAQLLDDTNATLLGHRPLYTLSLQISGYLMEKEFTGPRNRPPLLNAMVRVIVEDQVRKRLGANASEANVTRAFNAEEIIRYLDFWKDSTVASRILALNIAEKIVKPVEGYEEVKAEIDTYRNGLDLNSPLTENTSTTPGEDTTPISNIIDTLRAFGPTKCSWATQLYIRYSIWDRLDDGRRRDLLEDTRKHFHEYRPYATLAKAVQKLKYAHQYKQLESAQTGPIVVLPGLMSRLLNALGDIDQTRGPQLDTTSVIQESLNRLRLITEPVGPESFSSSITLRVPQGMVGHSLPKDSLLHEIGKVIPELWSRDVEHARETFRKWFRPADRPSRNREIHVFANSLANAERRAWQLANRGFDVRLASLPAYLNDSKDTDPADIDMKKPLYFVVARSSLTQVARWIRQFVYKESWNDDDQSITKMAIPPRIHQININKEKDVAPNAPATEDLLQELFHRRVSVRDIYDAFGTDVPGHFTRNVTLKRWNNNGVHISAEIATDDGALATSLEGWIPKLPEPGEMWGAWGENINTELNPERKKESTEAGLSRRTMQRIIAFLYQLGVNVLDMSASEQGMAFMSHIGFDFRTPEIRRRVLDEFGSYLRGRSILLSPGKQSEFDSLRHSWELLDFLLEDRSRIGKEFFDHYSREHDTLGLRFWLKPDFPGFKELFSNQLARSGELAALAEPEESEEDRARIVEQKAQQRQLLRKRRQSPSLYNTSIPEHVRREIAEALDAADYFAREAQQSLHDAEHDDKTGLETYGKLMSHNRALEMSLMNPRAEDKDENGDSKDHYVIMIDIDHFSRVNNNHGHPVGDDVLTEVTDMIQNEARPSDIVSRYGGEEFILVAKHCGEEGARKVAERVRKRIMRDPITSNAGGKPVSLTITVSLGVAPFRIIENGNGNGNGGSELSEVKEKKTSLSTAIRNADVALYQAKRNGRNRVEYNIVTSTPSRAALAVVTPEKSSWPQWLSSVGRFLNIFRHLRKRRERHNREE